MDDLPRIISLARKMGFAQVQIATSDVKLAMDLEFCRSLQRNGLNTVYLQFDGVTSAPYIALRGKDMLPIKLKAVDNMRRAGYNSLVLIPALARGVNDDHVGDIVRFASGKLDIIKGINFQPASFAGRIDASERKEKRLTIPDFLSLLEEQTDNQIACEDFYPVPFVGPITKLIDAETGWPQPVFTVHPCCGAATYLYIDGGKILPITRFLGVEALLDRIGNVVENFDGSSLGKLKMRGMILKEIPEFVDEAKVPDGLNINKLRLSVLWDGTRESQTEFHNKPLFIGAMHLQDVCTMDIERLQSCGVH